PNAWKRQRSKSQTSWDSHSREPQPVAGRTSASRVMPERPDWTASVRSAASTIAPTNTYWSAASCRALPYWQSCCSALEKVRDSTMSGAPADAVELLNRLQGEQIQNFWITYHDYSGIGAAKTI